MSNNGVVSSSPAVTAAFEPRPDWTLISQGAEARLWKIPNYLPDRKPALAKERFSKSYRHPILDERLTKQRCKAEVKCLVKCRRVGVCCPAIYGVNPPVIVMEFVSGDTVRTYVEQELANDAKDFSKLAQAMGELIGRVHNLGVVHGDLTTSNMMLSSKECSEQQPQQDNLTLIDFGLARITNNPEEMAVDLYVLERALTSTHPNLTEAFLETVLAFYKSTATKSHAVLLRLGQVRLRGRKRECFG